MGGYSRNRAYGYNGYNGGYENNVAIGGEDDDEGPGETGHGVIDNEGARENSSGVFLVFEPLGFALR